MGVIAEDLPTFSPKARDCGIPGRGGVGAATAVNWAVFSNVSNWGATGGRSSKVCKRVCRSTCGACTDELCSGCVPLRRSSLSANESASREKQ